MTSRREFFGCLAQTVERKRSQRHGLASLVRFQQHPPLTPQAKDGRKRANGRDITFPDGRTLFTYNQGKAKRSVPVKNIDAMLAEASHRIAGKDGGHMAVLSSLALVFSDEAAVEQMLAAPDAGITLTESYAMLPAASVAGFYLSHPDSRYFAVDKIGEDQAADYALRKALALEQTPTKYEL